MLIAALQPLTLLDYPNKLAAIIFTQGCNFACGYCHNPEMIPLKKPRSDSVLSPAKGIVIPSGAEGCPAKKSSQERESLPAIRSSPNQKLWAEGSGNKDPDLSEEKIFAFLFKRQPYLDGIVITGGEPTLQPDLEEFIRKVKDLGFLIKLDTNGSNPKALKKLLNHRLLDYVAMDVKHSKSKYANLVKNKDMESILRSIEIIKSSSVPYEFRSTILPFYHTKSDIKEMGKMIEGADQWCLQTFRPQKTLSRKLKDERAFTEKEMQNLKSTAEKYAKVVGTR